MSSISLRFGEHPTDVCNIDRSQRLPQDGYRWIFFSTTIVSFGSPTYLTQSSLPFNVIVAETS